MLKIDVGAATDTGNIRGQNEDALIATQSMFAVADGMGGHNAGEVASAMAISQLGEVDLAGVTSAEELAQKIRDLNSVIYAAATSLHEQRGMGTTLTAAAVLTQSTNVDSPPQLVVANVGDSRTYLLREGEMRQLSIDHSYVQELVIQGLLTIDEARTHPRRNIVTRALGIDSQVSVDTWSVPILNGDRFMLCSDGLVDEVPLDEISLIMQEVLTPQKAAEKLVTTAKHHGGRDNITVIIVDFRLTDEEATATTTDVPSSDPLVTPTSSFSPRKKVLAVALVLAICAGGFMAIRHQRSGYFVAFTSKSTTATLAIYKGQPGRLLWIAPTVVEVSTTKRFSMKSELQREIDRVQRFETVDKARSYIKTFISLVKSHG